MKRWKSLATGVAPVAALAVLVAWGCGGGGSGGGTGGTSNNSGGGTNTTGGGTNITGGTNLGANYGGTNLGANDGGTPTPTPSPTPNPGTRSATVAVTNNSSAPMGFAFASPVTVQSGTSVKWVNQSSAPHGITWDSFSPNTSPGPGANIPIFSAGATSSAWTAPTVTTNTTYNYHCTVHGTTMAGVITVTP